MITTVIPDDWQQLQKEVALILEDCGFRVEIEKTVRTVRGEVELDVYAEEEVDGRRYSIACECKHWKSRVPQGVVHGFRTVVSDLGINAAYIVALNGFQQGSFQASELTNVELTTWAQFQKVFEKTWFKKHFSPQIAERLDPLLSYVEPIVPKWVWDLPDNRQQEYFALKERYDDFGWLMMTFTPYARWRQDDGIPTLPVIDQLPSGSALLSTVPNMILNEVGYREFLHAVVAYGEQAIQQFRLLRIL